MGWRTVLRSRRDEGYVLTLTDGRRWVTVRTRRDAAEADELPPTTERVESDGPAAAGRAHRAMAGSLLRPG